MQQGREGHGCICNQTGDAFNAQAKRIPAKTYQSPAANVKGKKPPPITHEFGQMCGLASKSRANIQDVFSRLGGKEMRCNLSSLILDLKQALLKASEFVRSAPESFYYDSLRGIRGWPCCHTLLFKALYQFMAAKPEDICSYDRIGDTISCRKKAFGEVYPPIFHPPFDQPYGIGIKNRQVVGGIFVSIRKRNLISISAYAPEDRIYEGDNVFGTVGFALVHGLIDCSGIGDPVQKEDLVKGETKNVQDRRGYLL